MIPKICEFQKTESNKQRRQTENHRHKQFGVYQREMGQEAVGKG